MSQEGREAPRMMHKIYGGYPGKLKVYGWVEQAGSEFDVVFPEYRGHSRQVRMVVAAPSQAAAARAAGYVRPDRMWNLCETGNVIECGVALNEPEKVFWRPLDGHGIPYRERKVGPA